jgi:peptidoglycan/xylan/chitin deacetylase (PgdA/CDA1 family)
VDAILAFHSIDDGGSVLSYRRNELAQLIDGLRAEGVRFATLDELLAPAPATSTASSRAHRVAITFDDGFRSVREQALPVLAAASVPFTVFVVSDWVGRDNRWPSQPAGIARFELMGWKELAELRAAGVELGGHTANHVHLRGLAAAELARELDDSKRRLEQELGAAVRHFAYPYGSHDAASVAQVRAGYASAVTTKLAFLPEPPSARDRHLLPRLDAWYLREPARRLPLFGGRSRARLAWRALLRKLKGAAAGYGSG